MKFNQSIFAAIVYARSVAGPRPHFTIVTTLRRIAGVTLVLALTSCEAHLDLSGVEQTLKQSIRRTDQLMVLERVGDQLLMLGDNGLLLRRPVTGEHWQRSQLGYDQSHPDFISAAQCGDGSLVVLSYQAEGWRTDDQGDSWTTSPLPTEEDVQALECTTNNQLWVVGSYSTMFRSDDGGNSWRESTLGEDAMLTAVTFTSAGDGYVAGEFGLLATTADGGDNWQVVDPIGAEFYPLAVRFDSLGNGWVGGLQGVIMRSTDAGQSWQRTATPTESPIYNFVAVGDQLLATGDQGVVLLWSDNQWSKLDTPDIPTYFRTGVALDDRHALVAGGWGVLLPVALDGSL